MTCVVVYGALICDEMTLGLAHDPPTLVSLIELCQLKGWRVGLRGTVNGRPVNCVLDHHLAYNLALGL